MALQTNKFEMKIRQDDDSFVCDITNGSICLSVSNDGEEEDMQAIVDALNKPNVKWYSNNKLELDQHIEIMQLQDMNQRLVDALKDVQTMAKQGIFPHLPVETKGAQMCIEIDKYVAERLSEYNQSKGGKEGKV